jgi:hypothetical protein
MGRTHIDAEQPHRSSERSVGVGYKPEEDLPGPGPGPGESHMTLTVEHGVPGC